MTKLGPHLSVSGTLPRLPCLQALGSEGGPLAPAATWEVQNRERGARSRSLARLAGDLPQQAFPRKGSRDQSVGSVSKPGAGSSSCPLPAGD